MYIEYWCLINLAQENRELDVYEIQFDLTQRYSSWQLFTCRCFLKLAVSTLASPLPPSFLDTYSLSTSSLGCNTLCMVISFLALWSICLSSSLVYFKNGPEYLTSGSVFLLLLLYWFCFALSQLAHWLNYFYKFFPSTFCWAGSRIEEEERTTQQSILF